MVQHQGGVTPSTHLQAESAPKPACAQGQDPPGSQGQTMSLRDSGGCKIPSAAAGAAGQTPLAEHTPGARGLVPKRKLLNNLQHQHFAALSVGR